MSSAKIHILTTVSNLQHVKAALEIMQLLQSCLVTQEFWEPFLIRWAGVG